MSEPLDLPTTPPKARRHKGCGPNPRPTDDDRKMLEAAKMAARRFGVRADDIDDLTQIAVEKCFRQRHRFDPTRGEAGAFFYSIAQNAIRDELRKRKSQKAGGGQTKCPLDEERMGGSYAASQEHEVYLREIEAYVAVLEPQLQSVCAAMIAGLTVAETARRLGVARGTVYARQARIAKALRARGVDGLMPKSERPPGCSRVAVLNTLT